MSPRPALVLLCGVCAFAAAEVASVGEIVAAVRAAIEKGDADGTLAKALHKWKPSERVDDHLIEELESEGAGPKAVAELERLRDLSRGLPPAAVAPDFRHEGAPPVAEQRSIVSAAQKIALNYGRSLPDFICTEIIRRYDNVRGLMQPRDFIEVKLTYFDQHENYRVLAINGKLANRPLEDIGGAVSEGEFGSILASIFAGESKTVLQWDHWTTIRKRAAHVYTFRIPAETSTYRLQYREDARSGTRSVTAGQHGLVYIDRETHEVLRIYEEADVPADFPVRESSTLLDYDFTTVGGRRFLLPLRADVRMATNHVRTRNFVEFQGYRKFTGESTITFQ